ncbi:YcgN family cysteine cluster protein [Erythrobacteraceae bacterium CFH 75059]|nr:YcgN family cysteine cluster protein [Erythrobacteraceae bacterium CFH 75059]
MCSAVCPVVRSRVLTRVVPGRCSTCCTAAPSRSRTALRKVTPSESCCAWRGLPDSTHAARTPPSRFTAHLRIGPSSPPPPSPAFALAGARLADHELESHAATVNLPPRPGLPGRRAASPARRDLGVHARARRRPAACRGGHRGGLHADRRERAHGALERLRWPVPHRLFRLRLLPGCLSHRHAAHDARAGSVRRGAARPRRAGAANLHHHRPGTRHARGAARVHRRLFPEPSRPDRHARTGGTGGEAVRRLLQPRTGLAGRRVPDEPFQHRLPVRTRRGADRHPADGPRGRGDRRRAGALGPVRERFWELPLGALSTAEWEALCDGCGRCCLHKLEDEDTGEILETNVACALLDRRTARCGDYANRRTHVPDCLRLTLRIVEDVTWLPASCAYRLRAAGQPLPPWHHLVCGDRDAVRRAGASVIGRVISESEAGPLEHHVCDWPDAAATPA